MLPAEMASIVDGIRARVHQREQEHAEDGDEDADPEVVLANDEDGDNPPIAIIPEHRDDEPRDEYAFRVMQAVSQHQIESFNQMVQSMRDISTEVKKKKNEWGEIDEDEGDSDNSNHQDALERPGIRKIRKRIRAPNFKGMTGECPEPHLLRAVDQFDSQGI